MPVKNTIEKVLLVDTGNKWTWLYPAFLAVLVVIVTVNGPMVGLDTGSYQEHWATRQPLYPFVLDFFQGNLRLLVLVQALVGVLAVTYAARSLCSVLDTTRVIVYLACLILLLPFFPYYLSIGNSVLTESFSYSMFLVITGLFVRGLRDGSTGKILWLIVLLGVLLLLRKQFLFVYPVIFVILLMQISMPRRTLLILALVASFILSGAGERLYHNVYHGRYASTPFTGFQLIVMPLYTSKMADASVLSEEERAIFIPIRETMEQGLLSLESCERQQLPIKCGHQHFADSYNRISWQTVRRVLSSAGIDDWFEIDALTTSIALKLLRQNPVENGRLYLSAVHNGVGTYYLLFMLVILLGTFWLGLVRSETASLVILAVVAMNLANILMVALVEPLLVRYTFYTSFVQVAVFVAFFFRHKETNGVRNSR